MGTNLIWCSAIALEVVVLFRGMRQALLKKYPLFYAYVGCVLLIEVLRFCSYKFTQSFYAAFYWDSELVTIVASYGVIFEIFRQALRHNPGVARLAQKFLLVLFVIAVIFAASGPLHGGFTSIPRATADLGRYLRYLEGALLFVMLWLFGRYRISFGRNLLGLTVGYSFLVGLDVMNLALLSFPGNELSIVLRRLLPVTFVATLTIWCAALWSPQPEPAQPVESELEHDYGLLAVRTQAILTRASNRAVRTIRP
jgi:hypothetical protein